VSSSEIAFLALGLILGGALGAAFLAAVHFLPAPRREVRITIAPNSIAARRAVTLSDPTGARSRPSSPNSPVDVTSPDGFDPAPGIPGPATWIPATGGPEARVTASPLRTRVPSAPAPLPAIAVAVPIVGERPAPPLGGPASAANGSPGRDAVSAWRIPAAVAIAIADGPAPSARAASPRPTAILDVGRPSSEWHVRARPPVDEGRPTLAMAAGSIPIARADEPREPSPVAPASAAPAPVALPGAADQCAPARTAAEERCLEAVGARERARVAADAVREAKRALAELQERIDKARAASDPRAVAVTKGELHAAYREASAAAATPEEAEAAARHWLSAIDRANTDARAALQLVEAATAELREQTPGLERLAVESDAARINAEGAEQACRGAREALARCEELAAAAALSAAALPTDAGPPDPFATAWPTEPDLARDRGAPGNAAEDLAGLSLIVRVLRGDRAARERVVAAVAGDEPASVATWRLRVSALVDAIMACAIEAGSLDLPDDDPFWQLFTHRERREIVEALSSLGFRFDGLGGFADGRVPTARDLSLAVGYAGLDPMRIRIWPREGELAALYSRAIVAADAWLATRADDLALGSVVDALGPRAEDLGELWNAWGRIRTLLLTTD
jgi:hypothetical protein